MNLTGSSIPQPADNSAIISLLGDVVSLLTDIKTNTDPFSQNDLNIQIGNTSQDFVIPSGSREVSIVNAGGAGTQVTATVNGSNLVPGQSIKFTQQIDPATKEVLKIPILNIVTNGAAIWYTIST